jgi:hypothetical protein
MTTLVADRVELRDANGGLTLEQVISGAWEDLAARTCAACPVCGGEMRRFGEAGHCGGCGGSLS